MNAEPVSSVFAQAVAHHQAGQLGEAAALYRQILAVDPGNLASLNNLGLIAAPAEAVALFAQAVALKPDYTDALLNLGRALIGLGRYDEAAEPFAQLFVLRPSVAAEITAYGLALEARAGEGAAAAYFQRLAGCGVAYLDAHLLYGNMLHDSGRFDDAVRCYGALIRINPNQAPPHANLANTLMALGRMDEAKLEYDAAAAAEPANRHFRNNAKAIARMVDQRHHSCPPQLEPEVFDHANGRMVKRFFPQESFDFVYSIDVVGTCNLRCPSCPVGNFPEAERPKGFMDVEMFRAIVAKIGSDAASPHPVIWLFNWGEPMLHPQIEELIVIAKAAGFETRLSTNLNVEANLKGLARSGIDRIKISLSGISEQTYPLTHKRGNVTLVKGNMHLLRYHLDKAKADTSVWVCHHLYKGNQHEVPEVKALAESLGFEYVGLNAYYQSLERIVDWVREGKGDAAFIANLIDDPRATLAARPHTNQHLDCEMRFNMMAINHDGSIGLCCGVYDKPNMLGVNFLDHSHAEIQALKYRHSFCKTCYDTGLHYAPAAL